MSCTYPQCANNATFRNLYDAPSKCGKHREPRMIRDQICSHLGCTGTVRYGFENYTSCLTHRQPGMCQKRPWQAASLCNHVGCADYAMYGTEVATTCETHREPTMVFRTAAASL
jgi:hypothetical protein